MCKRELIQAILLNLLILIKTIIKQIGTQLTIQLLASLDDVLFASFFFEPLLDFIARFRGFDNLDPVTAGAARFL